MELKNRVVSGVAWTATEKFGSAALQLVVSVILMRILMPSQYGVIAMLTFFTFIANSIMDSGFSAALIRKVKPTTEDYSSVFYFNITISLVLYVLLCTLSYPIAQFYEEPDLMQFAPVVFAIIPINALGIIQGIVLQKQMDFRKLAMQNIIASVVSGAVAIYLAYTGWGAWALAFQMISMSVVRVGIMWFRGNWQPLWSFSVSSIKEFWNFSSRIFLTSLLNTTFANMSQMFIGKFYNASQLGLYYNAQKLRDLPVTSVTSAIFSVSFPAFVLIKDDPDKLRDASRKVMITLAFIMYPAMVGMIAVAPELFSVLLTDKWLESVPYFQILCLSALLIPISDTYMNVLMSKASGNKVLRLAIIRKMFSLLVLIVTIQISVMAIAWGQILFLAFDTFIYAYSAKKYVKYSVAKVIRDILPYFTLVAVMYLAVMSVSWALPDADQLLVLVIKIAVGALSYLGLAWLFKMEAWLDTSEIVRGMIRKIVSI